MAGSPQKVTGPSRTLPTATPRSRSSARPPGVWPRYELTRLLWSRRISAASESSRLRSATGRLPITASAWSRGTSVSSASSDKTRLASLVGNPPSGGWSTVALLKVDAVAFELSKRRATTAGSTSSTDVRRITRQAPAALRQSSSGTGVTPCGTACCSKLRCVTALTTARATPLRSAHRRRAMTHGTLGADVLEAVDRGKRRPGVQAGLQV